ncbi:MAG: type I DNA topoisomerase [Patescibacteria group bacterium]
MKNLIIVESPTKARTIGKFLGKDYEIKASMGHIMDLPKSKLGVDEKTLEPQYEVVSEKRMIIADLKDSSKHADAIILATDPDREGEAIASHIKDMLAQDKKLNIKNKKLLRIVFHEITKEAIEEALKNPREIDEALVDAQTARRVLDRLVGYKISPVLWQKVRRGLSAGRVQSVALRLIVEREREIEKFKKEKYWSIHAIFEKEKKEAEFELIEINGEKLETQETFDLYDGQYRITKSTIDSLKKAQKIVEDLNSKKFTVAEILQKEIKRSPYPPYTTSTLQQDASRRLGFAGRRTMSLAQKLYEEGYITYHRTDSVNMAGSAVAQIRSFVESQFGKRYLSPTVRVYKTKQKLAQEAHEAIRPTNAVATVEKVSRDLGRDYGRLYEIIWARAIATQMADAITESTTVFVASNGQQLTSNNSKVSSEKPEVSSYLLKANGSVLIFDGFLKLTPQVLNDNILPDFDKDEKLSAKNISEKEHETLSPPRYNEASLIATLEEKGIGRPSTYATIVSTIEGRKYIEREEGRFCPTPVGTAVNDFLVANFSTIDDIPFTAEMEDQLDAIANEKKEWNPMIKKFYADLTKSLETVKGADRVKIATEEVDEKCPKCSSSLVIRYGKFGKFLSCSTFPACDFTKPFVEEVGIPCPKDGDKGGQVITRNTKKGRKFYGCSNYPKCDFAAWRLEDIKKYQK